jgi:succinate dehydrogenase / fumarate reductase, cytochrome b subunit
MTGVLSLTRTSVGKKVIMAVTGMVLVGFVVFHMYGNTKMYGGAEVFNAYAKGLREIGYPIFGKEQLLWVARLVLLSSVVGHIWAATSLTRQSMAAMGTNKRPRNYAAFTMRYGGLLIALFIAYHVMHLTFGAGIAEFDHSNPYMNVVYGFQSPLVVAFYSVTMVFLSLHLYHGVWSGLQTLGLNSRNSTQLFRGLAIVVAGLVLLGNLSFPLSVMLGIVS